MPSNLILYFANFFGAKFNKIIQKVSKNLKSSQKLPNSKLISLIQKMVIGPKCRNMEYLKNRLKIEPAIVELSFFTT